MQNKIILTLAVIVFSFLAHAEEARYETLAVTTYYDAAANGGYATNELAIADYETGEIVAAWNLGTLSHIIKGDVQIVPARVSDIVRGPATFRAIVYASPGYTAAAYMTVKITPVSFPPYKTITVPPGTNQVLISLESSTNLINWQTATNGVYGSPTTVQFFRLKETKLN